ncbi:hypothetical protein FRB95_001656 [Tulasnella sp. JGI-2019a]|nr:hypothetical protein FRB95_001656 [Tulasnella sp. JGI-2019a]
MPQNSVAPCRAVAPVVFETQGGNGADAPNYHVVYWPHKDALVVVHEGTSLTELKTVLIDLKITQRRLDPRMFPSIPSGVEAHSGFVQTHALSATQILATVRRALANGVHLGGPSSPRRVKPKRVIVTGYSMGGAVAVLNAMYLRLHLPPSTPVSSFTVGTPKIGNAAFAAWSDKVLAPVAINSVRIVNAHDIVPTLPLPHTSLWPSLKSFISAQAYQLTTSPSFTKCH